MENLFLTLQIRDNYSGTRRARIGLAPEVGMTAGRLRKGAQ